MNDKRGQLIGLQRPSKRKQLAPPPLSSITERKYWKGGWGFTGMLDWQSEQWGGQRSCWASALHSTGRRQQRELPQALAATGGLCGLSSWVLQNQAASQLFYQSQTTSRLICPCVSTYFHKYMCTCASSQLCTY